MRILLTGACGYVGSVLLKKLLMAGHYVEGVDLQWFGNYTGMHINKVDFREYEIKNIDAVIHLANIANDPSAELDPKLSWEVNALGTRQLAESAVRAGVKQFIYASSGSVYGVNNSPSVNEDAPLYPLSEYNKTKSVAERVLLSYDKNMIVQILRPATVCGLSPRMRMDVAVNGLAIQALVNKEITVFGGSQMRPNIHIEDMTNLYLFMLDRPTLAGIYNAGFQNLSIMEIAQMISDRTKAKLIVSESNDPRSYRMDSGKLLATGFKPKQTVKMAISQMIEAFNACVLEDKSEWYNVKRMIANAKKNEAKDHIGNALIKRGPYTERVINS